MRIRNRLREEALASQVYKVGSEPVQLDWNRYYSGPRVAARRLCPEGVQIHCGNAARLSFDNGSFDLALQFTVFSSILDIAVKEMCVNNPRNPDVRGIRKRKITHLFPNCRISLHRVLLGIALDPSTSLFLAGLLCARKRSDYLTLII
jgi:hypothetical protein